MRRGNALLRQVGVILIKEMDMCYIVSMLLSVSMLFSVSAIYIAIRNQWVFKRRTELNRFDGKLHVITQYVDYDTMMYKFWVWDIEKLKLPNVR